MSNSRTPPYLTEQPRFLSEYSLHPETRRSGSISFPSPSSHRGAHRDGFSVEKCKDVLVRHCSRIPRNYSFKDGIHRVYWILREYLGDENMDLAIAQLYELIELPSDWTDDEGAAFQPWKHDYMLKNKDFENSHVPRLGNIIVAPIKPSERLQKWRQEHGEHETCNLSSGQSLQRGPSTSRENFFRPSFGIRPRGHGGWRVDMALFVSNKAEGTRVLHCPTPQELHKRTWDEGFGRGGRFIQERIIVPGEPIDPINESDLSDPMPRETPSYMRKTSDKDIFQMKPFPNLLSVSKARSTALRIPTIVKNSLKFCRSSGIRHRLSRNEILENESWRPQYSQFRDPLFGRYHTDVKAYESNKAVKELPNPYTDVGKIYYQNIKTQSLEPHMAAPNPAFARKHGLRAQAMPVHRWIDYQLMPTAEDIAIQRGFRKHEESVIQTSSKCFNGPFTAEMFKDSGIDFPSRWRTTESLLASDDGNCDTSSNTGSLVHGAQSPSREVQCISKCLQKYDAGIDSPSSDAARVQHNADSSENRPHSNIAQENLMLSQQTVGLRGGAGSNCSWVTIFAGRFMSKTRTRSMFCCYFHKGETISQSDFTPKSTQRLLEIYTMNFFSQLSYERRWRINSKLIKSYISSSLTHIPREIVTQFKMNQKEAMKSSNLIMTDMHRGEAIAVVRRPQGSSSMISCKSKASTEQTEPLVGVFPARLGLDTSRSRRVTLFKPEMTPSVKSTATPTGILVSMSNACKSPKVILESNPAHETSAKLSRGIEEPHSGMVVPPMRVSLDTQCKSRGNNKQHHVEASNDNDCGHSQILRRSLPYFPETSKHMRKSSFSLDYETFNESGKAYLSVDHEMDLDRELPPLPVPNSIMRLRIHKTSREEEQMKLEKHKPEHLLQARYDPIRDGLKYGGIQYHPEGIRYWPEASQYHSHTSPMSRASTNTKATSKSTHIESEARKFPNTRAGSSCAATVSARHEEVSTDIMGDFMPLAPSGQRLQSVAGQERITPTPEIFGKQMAQNIDFTNEGPKNYEVAAFYTPTVKLEKIAEAYVDPKNKLHIVDLEDTSALYAQRPKKRPPKDSVELRNIDPCAREYQAGSTYQAKSLPKHIGSDRFEAMNVYTDDDTFVGVEESGYQKSKSFKNLFEGYQELGGGNPFECDGDIPDKTLDRITTFTDFISEADTHEPQKPSAHKKLGHIKNSYSESNAFSMSKWPASILNDKPLPLGSSRQHQRQRQRSDSSPGISPMRQHRDTVIAYHGLSRSEDERQHFSSIHQGHLECDPLQSTPRGRGLRSPVKYLADVSEKDETIAEQTIALPKRSRSPLKKMFGEGGWLSNAVGPKEELSNQRRPGLRDKIKNKMEEIGLKADVSPAKHAIKINNDKKSLPSTFPISLDPAQQADVYSAIELTICNTANTFLMHQYQNCRMSVDSLKKVTDFWKGKGRPQVMEFRYDQSTQRDLIVANQKSFRFLGPNADDPLRINAMLYAWKHNAREMSVRTFCYPDSLIRNHIRDSFMILDFLGGHPAQHLTLYEVRAKFTRWVEESQQPLAARYSTGSWVENREMKSHRSSSEQVAGNLRRSHRISGGPESTTSNFIPKHSLDGSSALGDGDEASDPYKLRSQQMASKAYFSVSDDNSRV